METSITTCFCISEIALSFFIPTSFPIFNFLLCEVIMIHEVVACVVGRVDVYHLHLAHIGVLEQFEHFEVVALNIEVLGGVPVDALFRTRAQGFSTRSHRLTLSSPLANPREVIHLWGIVHRIITQQRTQFLKVHHVPQLSVLPCRFRKARGAYLVERIHVQLRPIHRLFV